MTTDTKTGVGNVIGTGAIGFGVTAVVAPRVITAIYGAPGTAPFRWIIRLWGTRTATLGALILTESDPGRRRRLVAASAVMNSLDTAISATAGPDLPKRTRILATVTSGGFAAAALAHLAGVLD